MNLLAWAMFGLITGIVANALDPAPNRGGLIGSVILGLLGAMVGGFVANVLFGATFSGFSLASFMIAVVGSLLLLGASHAMKRF